MSEIARARTGVYFLADDGVREWLPPMLASLRMFNPDLSVWCIPFSDQLDFVESLRRQYRFEIVRDSTLRQLDEIGRPFVADWQPAELTPHAFRKLAAFWGPLDFFLFLDSDVLVLSDLTPILDTLLRSGHDLLYADANVDFVYDAIPFQHLMADGLRSHGFNTGVWASRRGLLTLTDVERTARLAGPLIPHFYAAAEQAFLNFCVDMRRGVAMDYVQNASAGRISCVWPGIDRGLQFFGAVGPELSVFDSEGSRVSVIHWAGFEVGPAMPMREFHESFRPE
jgi:hypothetical protein